MRKKTWQQFTKSGKIEDYLAYKKYSQQETEFAQENLKKGEKNEPKKGNNS